VSDVLNILAVLALVAGNAFFVIGEYSVVTARRTALQPRAEAGSAGAQAALRLMADPVRVISTVQVGITAIGILTGAIGEPLVRGLLGGGVPQWVSFAIAFATVTYLSVVLGELVPKALTLQRSEALAALVARPIELISVALRPIVWVLQSSAALLLRPFGISDVIAGDSIRTADELRALVDEAEGAGVIPRAQEEMLHNVFDFADREVRDIMVPALDVVWLDADLTADEALDRVVESPHGRYPVGRGDLDHLAGVVHVRDLIIGSRRRPGASLAELARPAFVVPETKDLGPLLRELREQHEQLAVVVDEYGAVAGIVTLEDVIEELVGEIQDEFDLPDARIRRIDERTLRVAGSMTIDDFNEAVGTDLPQRGARTLAGLAFDALGRRPKPGDRISFGDVEVSVLTVEGLRITELEVRLPAPAGEEPGPTAGDEAPASSG
jgi:putative hemolysin